MLSRSKDQKWQFCTCKHDYIKVIIEFAVFWEQTGNFCVFFSYVFSDVNICIEVYFNNLLIVKTCDTTVCFHCCFFFDFVMVLESTQTTIRPTWQVANANSVLWVVGLVNLFVKLFYWLPCLLMMTFSNLRVYSAAPLWRVTPCFLFNSFFNQNSVLNNEAVSFWKLY